MNVKIQSDHLDGFSGIQNTQAPASHRVSGHGAAGRAEDSVGISDLSVRIIDHLSAADSKLEARIAELGALYAQGRYEPDAAALSRSMISRAVESNADIKS